MVFLVILQFFLKFMNFNLDNFQLTVPHKNMLDRNFVLYPLKEICPNWVHPVIKKNIDVLINNLKTSNNEITKLSESDIKSYVKYVNHCNAIF